MPKELVVQAQVPERKDASGKVIQAAIGPFSIKVQSANSAEEAIQMFGGEAVLSNAESNWVVTLQGNMRAGMKKGEGQAQLQVRLGGAKMGVAQKGAVVDPIASYMAMYASATPEKQKEMIAELTAKAKAAAAGK